jgi:hypothetical protein
MNTSQITERVGTRPDTSQAEFLCGFSVYIFIAMRASYLALFIGKYKIVPVLNQLSTTL